MNPNEPFLPPPLPHPTPRHPPTIKCMAHPPPPTTTITITITARSSKSSTLASPSSRPSWRRRRAGVTHRWVGGLGWDGMGRLGSLSAGQPVGWAACRLGHQVIGVHGPDFLRLSSRCRHRCPAGSGGGAASAARQARANRVWQQRAGGAGGGACGVVVVGGRTECESPAAGEAWPSLTDATLMQPFSLPPLSLSFYLPFTPLHPPTPTPPPHKTPHRPPASSLSPATSRRSSAAPPSCAAPSTCAPRARCSAASGNESQLDQAGPPHLVPLSAIACPLSSTHMCAYPPRCRSSSSTAPRWRWRAA